MTKKKSKPVEVAPEIEPEVEVTEAHALEVMFGGPEFASHDLPYSGAAVRYVLHTGPNVGQVRDAVIVELYGETMHLEVTTAPGDSFANPLTLIRVPYSAAKTPGTWHWPVEA